MTKKTIEQAYEELRQIIDGGSESFTHDDAVEYLKEKLAHSERELVTWRNAAIRVGEDLCSVGPLGYYDMTAKQWLDWALSVVTVHAPPSQPKEPEQIAVCIGYWNQKTGAYYKPDQISASHQKLIEDGVLRRCYTTPPQREPLTDEMVYAAARAMSDTHAESCGVDKDDHWKLYGDVYNDDARIMLKAAHGIKE